MEASSRPGWVQTGSKAQMLQQRLLLLNHSSKCCVHDNEICQVSRHCGQFRNLWKHILACKDNACKTMHCLSSRYVLSHYAKCVDMDCFICPRVRESAKREANEPACNTNNAAKRARSSYWWASETFVQFSKAVTVTTNDFISPPPSHLQHPVAHHPNLGILKCPSVDRLNLKLNQLSIVPHAEMPPRKVELCPSRSHSSLDLLGAASAHKPPTRPRASSGASTATGCSSASEGGRVQSLSPSLPSSSSSSSALFAHLQPAPFVSVSYIGCSSFSSASAAQQEEPCNSNLSSFSSVCSYRDSTAVSPYMTPQMSPVSFKNNDKDDNKLSPVSFENIDTDENKF